MPGGALTAGQIDVALARGGFSPQEALALRQYQARVFDHVAFELAILAALDAADPQQFARLSADFPQIAAAWNELHRGTLLARVRTAADGDTDGDLGLEGGP